MKNYFDVAIVGSGLCGSEAFRLLGERSSLGIVMLEAGKNGGVDHVNSLKGGATVQELWLNPSTDPSFWTPWRSRSAHFGETTGLRSRLGGRSLYWHGVLMELEDWATDKWPRSVVEQLRGSKRVEQSYYERVLNDVKRSGFSVDGRASLLVDFLTCQGEEGFIAAPMYSRRWRVSPESSRWSSYSAIGRCLELARVEGERCLVYNRCWVEDIVARGDAFMLSVQSPEGRKSIMAGKVVLAGGAVENTRLASQLLDSHNDQVVFPGLFDHMVVGALRRIKFTNFPSELRDSMPIMAYRPSTVKRRFNVFVCFSPSSTENGDVFLLDTWAMIEQTRQKCNCIRVLEGTSEIVAGQSNEDQRLLNDARTELRRLVRTVSEAADLNKEPFYSVSVADLRSAISRATQSDECIDYCQLLGSVDHEGGTLPIGTITDDKCTLASVPNAVVLGPSTFPRMGASNPSFTSLALCHLAIDNVIRRS